jgi:hypothetical protein
MSWEGREILGESASDREGAWIEGASHMPLDLVLGGVECRVGKHPRRLDVSMLGM